MTPALSVLHIENTTACNLHCRHCTRIEPGYPVQSMPWSVFEKLLPIMRERKPFVMLNGHGEPLLLPDFEQQFQATAAAGCRVRFQSNAQLLKPGTATRLIATGNWECFAVSLDACTKELYEFIRVGASWDRLQENMAAFRAERGASDKPILNVEFVAMKQNIHELPGVARVAASWGAASVLVTEFWPTAVVKDQSLAASPELFCPPVREAQAVAKDLGVRLDLQPGEAAMMDTKTEWHVSGGVTSGERKVCRTPWTVAFVKATGEVWPCCKWGAVMGNLANQTFDEVWNGEPWTKLREDMEAGRLTNNCRTCAWV